MVYGIVGNRKGWSKDYIFSQLKTFKITPNDIIVSGGAEGVDSYAQEFAKSIGCQMVIYYPRQDMPVPQRYFERNELIAKSAEILIAFDKGNNTSGSGTLNTINTAKKLEKLVKVYK